MNHLKALAVVLGICLVGFVGWQVWKETSKPNMSPMGILSVKEMETAGVPVLSGRDIFGREYSTENARGKVLVLNFWASWCGPCVQEVPSLIRLVKEFDGKIQVVAISEDNSLDDIKIFLKSFPDFKNKNISIVWDGDHALMQKFAVQALPESYVANGDAKLVKKISGAIDWHSADAKQYMTELVVKKK